MNDPHVESLTYLMEASPGVVRFDNPPPLVHETDTFRLRLTEGVLAVEMKAHFSTAEEARTPVERFLTDWTLFAALDFDTIPMKFTFQSAHQIDRNPPPQAPENVTAEAHITVGRVAVQGLATFTPPMRNKYPSIPAAFKASPDVETMWFRYRLHVEGREPIASMAYACLTILEGSTGLSGKKGARDEAAHRYKVDREVLKMIGETTSKKGAPYEARKLDAEATRSPLTDSERRWLRHAIKRLIQRKAEYDSDPTRGSSLSQITMADLPPL